MFKKLKSTLHKKDKNKAPVAVPQVDSIIQKRIDQLRTVRNTAQELIDGIRIMCTAFNDGTKKNRNICESFAIGVKILANHVGAKDPEYSQFLSKLQTIYDEIGKSQRNMVTMIEEKVCMPLESWLKSEYPRIEVQIETLYTKKRYADAKTADPVENENNKKDYEGQLNVVKHELLKLSHIKIDHWEKTAMFFDIMKEFYAEIQSIIEKVGADTWTGEGLEKFKKGTTLQLSPSALAAINEKKGGTSTVSVDMSTSQSSRKPTSKNPDYENLEDQ
ncbi:unnamed protein product [Bursaphelenchus okinawaensis]|uniref:BAR domain-containing protein n=1 Tax=Bursaphelenchus okinawaensis TaxID=465554 RepID=A0A811KZ34_9BILA|nr:unnamed protein product [Bursaphelenchus okinawaensis]CAG9113261.1 unnamed protein product [Bursaphelenchus okinawaensis]